MAPALCFCFQLAIGRIRGAEAIPQPSAVLTDLLKLCCQVFRALAPASQLLARLGELGHLKVVQAFRVGISEIFARLGKLEGLLLRARAAIRHFTFIAGSHFCPFGPKRHSFNSPDNAPSKQMI